MAPEQAAGKVRDTGPAADVYALGALLYECLTGRPPFEGSQHVILVSVLNDEPVPPSRVGVKVPADLETICLKCLSKEPARRYASAEELANDLRRFRAGEPIRARPVGAGERAAKWVRRHAAVSALAAAVLLVTVLGVAAVVWKYLDAEQQKGIALAKEADAKLAADKAQREADKAERATDYLVSIFELANTRGRRGTMTARQILDDAEKSLPQEFADQPELRQKLLQKIGAVYDKMTAAAPLAMILEARGAVQLQSTRDPGQRARPQTLLYSGDRLRLGADSHVELVVLSDLHKERLRPGTEATVRRKGCEPAEAISEPAQDPLMNFVRLPKGSFYMGWGGQAQREDVLESSATIVLQGQPFATAALLAYQPTAPARARKTEIKEDFEIAVHDVTQGQWQSLMGENPSYFSRFGGGRHEVKEISDEELKLFPVESVSWNDAQEFIKKLNEQNRDSGFLYRLPTDAEWEYACRGGATSLEECSYHFYSDKPSNDLSSDQANFDGNYPFGKAPKGRNLGRPTRVGSYPPNKLGLCDMHGNVFQWCAEQFAPRASYRVVRGGGWFLVAGGCRAAYRSGGSPVGRSGSTGFRLARVPVRPK
jgi:formylglycine-generating enzyme required for sulfatase activity